MLFLHINLAIVTFFIETNYCTFLGDMTIKMRSGFLDIFFDARNSLFRYVTNTNISNYASMQYSNILKNCKYIIAFNIRQ
jgi:hypothetical protein